MTAGEKKMIDKNLDLIFEFERVCFGAPGARREDSCANRRGIHESGQETKSSTVGARAVRKSRPRRADFLFRSRSKNWVRFVRRTKGLTLEGAA